MLWTRLLGHVLGASIYAFATMLAAFLVGITVGSAVAARLASTRARAAVGLAFCQFGTALLSIAVYLGLDTLTRIARHLEAGESSGLASNAIVAAAVLLPATLFIGATFPFAVRVLARRGSDAAPSSARVYAWNTVGAIVGAVATGFAVIPWFGFEGAVRLAVSVNLLLGVIAVLFVPGRSWKRVVAAAAVAATAALLFQPDRPETILRVSPFQRGDDDGRLHYYGVGRSATVLMLERAGGFELRTNGLPEAAIAPKGMPPLHLQLQQWLAAVPVLARPHARSMLIVGLGGGVTVEGVPPTIESIDVVEIEPLVRDANEAIASQRLEDPLADPRVRLIFNDARAALALSSKRYDLIASQPSHPWTAGASHLYTREFVSLARRHLTPGGVYLQWMHTRFVDRELFRTLGATLLDVFEHVRLYRPKTNMVLFLASDAPLEIERELARSGEPLASSAGHFSRLGINDVNDVAAILAADHEGLVDLCRGAPISTDNYNRMATGPRLLESPLGTRGTDELLLPLDPLTRDRYSDLEIRRSYVAYRLANNGMLGRARAIADSTPDPTERLLATALVLRSAGQEAQAAHMLDEALRLDPERQDVAFAVVRPWLGQVTNGGVPEPVLEAAGHLRGPWAAVVKGWQEVGRGAWSAVKALEADLARASSTDICYSHAAWLRAGWRIKSTADAAIAPASEEALRILDRALAADPWPQNYMMRIEAAVGADRPHVVLQTARIVAGGLDAEWPRADERRRQVIRLTSAILDRIVKRLADDPRVPPHRLEELRALLGELARR